MSRSATTVRPQPARWLPGGRAPAAGCGMTTSRVLLADDQALLRHGLQMMVDAQPDLEVVGQAADGAEAVELSARLNPDVVLMDIRMPRMDGVEATRRICGSAGPDGGPKVIVLTT